jgi:hypothetical protein
VASECSSFRATTTTPSATSPPFEDAGFFLVDLGGLREGGEMQQFHHPLAGLNLVRLP